MAEPRKIIEDVLRSSEERRGEVAGEGRKRIREVVEEPREAPMEEKKVEARPPPPPPPKVEASKEESEFEEVLPVASEGLRDAIRWFESLPEEERRKRVEKFLSWVSSLLRSGDPIRAGVEMLNAFAQHDELIVYFLYLFRPGFKVYAAKLLASVAQFVGRLAKG